MFKKVYSSEELKSIYLIEKEKYKTAEFGLWDNELNQIEANLYSDTNTKQILKNLGLIDTIRFMSFSQYVHEIHKYQQHHNISGLCQDTIEITVGEHKDKINYKYPFMSLMQRRKDSALAKKELIRIYNWWFSKYEYAEGVYMDDTKEANNNLRAINVNGVKEYINMFGFWGLLTYSSKDVLIDIDGEVSRFNSLVLTVGSTTIYDPNASEPHNVENFIMIF
jgi:hypothetical protein